MMPCLNNNYSPVRFNQAPFSYLGTDSYIIFVFLLFFHPLKLSTNNPLFIINYTLTFLKIGKKNMAYHFETAYVHVLINLKF